MPGPPLVSLPGIGRPEDGTGWIGSQLTEGTERWKSYLEKGRSAEALALSFLSSGVAEIRDAGMGQN